MTTVSQIQTVPPFHLDETTAARGYSPQNLQFYTAPSSPMQLNSDEFEFEITNEMFSSRCEFQQTYPAFAWAKRNYNTEQKYWLPARAKSFGSGHVLPLKLPPRLQTSVSSSPRSPNSLVRSPFSRPCAWNDDFDPFQFALEKVSEETRARMSFHRRSHSYSAYRTSSVSHWLEDKQGLNPSHDGSRIFNQGEYRGFHVGLPMKSIEQLKPRGPTLAKLMKRKESAGVPKESTVKSRSKSNPMIRTRNVWMGADVDHEAMKTQSESRPCAESKRERVMSFLFKLKKGTNYESKSGWKLRRCLGYGLGSPPSMK
ncbi:unnamed protein product [Lactuca saligna]|uniref:Uncharacterized protein n=1 Tax=Lactuca saligna TaxID=75948 RepID=A0AA35YNZ2_LACSI|nr:unnamed protein product [Lactuca saligna]